MAKDFDGSTNHLVKSVVLTTRDNWTLACWVNIDSLPMDFGMVQYNGEDGDPGPYNGYGFGVGGDNGGNGSKLVGLFGGIAWKNSGYTFSSNATWYHVVMTRASGTLKFYVNGTDVGYSNTDSDNGTPSGSYTLGAQDRNASGYGALFNGKIAEAGVWNRALSASEITALSQGYSPLFFLRELKSYIPIIGGTPIDYLGGSVTVGGTLSDFVHPRIFYPFKSSLGFAPTGGTAYTITINDTLSLSEASTKAIGKANADTLTLDDNLATDPPTSAVVIAQTANPNGATASGTVATYANQAIGTAVADRVVVVLVACELASTPIASCTLGGVPMNAGTAGNFGAVYTRAFYLNYPTGTTATVAVTFTTNSPSNVQNHISVYKVTGGSFLSSGGDGSTDMDATDPLTTGSTTIPVGGGMIAVAGGATDTGAKTWSELTEDLDVDAGALRYTTAFSTTAGTATRTCLGGTNNEDGAMSWLIFKNRATITKAVTKSIADTLSLADSVTKAGDKAVSDTLSLSDGVTTEVSAGELTQAVSDTLSLSDNVTKAIGKNNADTLSLADANTKAVAKPIADTLSMTDEATGVISTAQAIDDTLSLTDNLTKEVGKNVPDTLSLADNITKSIAKPISDTLSVADEVNSGISKPQAIADTLSLADNLVKSIGKNNSDTLSLADNANKEVSKPIADTLSLSDNTNRVVGFNRSVADTLSISDNLTKDVSKPISDTLLLTDNTIKEVGKNNADTLSISDNISKEITKSISDTLSLMDAMSKAIAKLNADTLSTADSVLAQRLHTYLGILATMVIKQHEAQISIKAHEAKIEKKEYEGKISI